MSSHAAWVQLPHYTEWPARSSYCTSPFHQPSLPPPHLAFLLFWALHIFFLHFLLHRDHKMPILFTLFTLYFVFLERANKKAHNTTSLRSHILWPNDLASTYWNFQMFHKNTNKNIDKYKGTNMSPKTSCTYLVGGSSRPRRPHPCDASVTSVALTCLPHLEKDVFETGKGFL